MAARGRRELARVTEPMPTSPLRALTGGTVLWALALLALLLVRTRLAPDEQWWVWTAVVGVVVGLLGTGWALLRRRRAQSSRASTASAASAAPGPVADGSSGSGSVSSS